MMSSFGKMLAHFALAEYGDLGDRLTRICRLAEKVDARLANLFCAYSITNRSRALMSPRHFTTLCHSFLIGTGVPVSLMSALSGALGRSAKCADL
jgi:hypothetical protein